MEEGREEKNLTALIYITITLFILNGMAFGLNNKTSIMQTLQDDTITETADKMATLSQVLEKLRLKKLDNEFRWENGQFNAGKGKGYNPEDLTIIKTFRFEGDSNPSDSSVLYIIEAKDGLIGYSIDAYGVYSNHDDEEGYDNAIRNINVEDRDEQLFFDL